MSVRVAVLGAGSWGTTVAALACINAPTTLWARRPEVAREICEERRNSRYLGEADLPSSLKATSDLEEAVRGADVLVLGVPSHGLRAVLGEAAAYLKSGAPIISLAKGLEEDSNLRMTEVIADVIPGHPVGCLTGPNLAREILAGYAAASVVAMEDLEIARATQKIFSRGVFRVYTNHDVVGCEMGGALKNVIAIACGMGDGIGVGDNTRAAVITRGLAEVTRLGVEMGGEPQTFSGLAGMGDLIATCSSRQSRNRHVGEQLGRGLKIDQVIADMHMVAEGVKSCGVVMDLAASLEIEMPIAREVYGAVHEGRTPTEAYRGLMRRRAGSEQEPG